MYLSIILSTPMYNNELQLGADGDTYLMIQRDKHTYDFKCQRVS